MNENKLFESIMPSEKEEKPVEALERKGNELLDEFRDASLEKIGVPNDDASEEEKAAAAARRKELTGIAQLAELREKIGQTPDDKKADESEDVEQKTGI